MSSEPSTFDDVTTKLVACAVIVVCLLIGLAGLLLPIVPGLLFLLVAAAVAAKLSPSFERLLRRNATVSGYLDRTDGFVALPLGDKIRVACLLGVKMLVDGVTLLVSVAMRLVRSAERR